MLSLCGVAGPGTRGKKRRACGERQDVIDPSIINTQRRWRAWKRAAAAHGARARRKPRRPASLLADAVVLAVVTEAQTTRTRLARAKGRTKGLCTYLDAAAAYTEGGSKDKHATQ